MLRGLPGTAMLALSVALLLATPAVAKKPPPAPTIEEQAATLTGRALTGDHGWDLLAELCDTVGHRLSGSAGMERAVAWGMRNFELWGLEPRAEEIMVPVWVRGPASLTQHTPIERSLAVLALGGTVATPPAGIRAPAVVVHSFDELDQVDVDGKIVVYDVPFTTYGETVQYRGRGASEASHRGAVAALVRSVTPTSLSTPHTGMMWYADDVPAQIPTAAITVEDAIALGRTQDAGHPLELTLQLQAETRPDAPSANVVAEVRGRELPDEIVVVGCHLDSWDVGQGAQDDGAGCVMAMEALRLIAGLDVQPRRTVRAVLFTNEENGLRGGKGYAEAHASERHFAAIEADIGAGPNFGFRMDVQRGDEAASAAASQRVYDALSPHLPLLASVSGATLEPGGSGADVGPLVREHGALGFGLALDTTGYWPIHHTEADTLDKIDPANLRDDIATMAVWAYVLAEVADPLATP
jgi:carboxypeptidase Q